MTKKDDNAPKPDETPPPPPPPPVNPTQEDKEQWQDHVKELKAQIQSLQQELALLRADKTPPTDLKPLESELSATKQALAEATKTLSEIQTQLRESPPERKEDAPPVPAPKPEPKRKRAAWV